MASTVRPRFRQHLPGHGRDSAGNTVQGKTRVVGEVNLSTYNGGGEALTPRDLGLTTIDAITLRVANAVPGADGKHALEVVYAKDSQQFYVVDVDAAGSRLHFTVGSSNEVIEFDAFGDAATAPELT